MTVTCIMPTADRPLLAPLAIHCFLQQDFTDAELLIVDDGARAIAELVPQHPRIRYVRLNDAGPKLNTGAKRNLCCELAAGEIIAHVDDDDWFAPTRLSDQVEFLRASGKQLTGYNTMLYYDLRVDRAYRWTGPALYAAGTSQCYFKTWWQRHRFHAVQSSEDSCFSQFAKEKQQLASKPGAGQMVARHHAGNTWRPDLGGKSFPVVDRSQLPAQFFADVQSIEAQLAHH